MSEPVTEQQLKWAFWHSVIQTQNTVRLVAQSEMGRGGSGGGPVAPMIIFVPTGPEDDFDLVLSLCADGTQRVTVDWDMVAESPRAALKEYSTKMSARGVDYHRSRIMMATPSTNNWALWGNAQVTWDTVKTVLASVDNPGYYEMNSIKGYCGLRPPWKNKHEMTFHDAIGMRFERAPDMDMFAGIDWSQVPEPEPEVTGTGWDELGWDDE